jgi:hypothetical protein
MRMPLRRVFAHMLCAEYIWGYVLHWIHNILEQNSTALKDVSGMMTLGSNMC